MKNVPEPSLHPPEYPPPVLRCCLCHRPVPEALDLLYGPICRRCLQNAAETGTMDELSALLCAAIILNETSQKEDTICCQDP